MADDVRVRYVDPRSERAARTVADLRERLDGVTIETAASVGEATDGMHGLDAVITEYSLAGATGIDLLKQVRETRPELPVFLYTGDGSERIASDAIAAGVTDYVPRTDDSCTELAGRLSAVVSQSRDREKFLEAVEATGDGVALLDSDERFRYVDDSFTDLFSVSGERIRGKTWAEVCSGPAGRGIEDEIPPNERSNGRWTGTVQCTRSDGTTFSAELTVSRPADGGFICVVRDQSTVEAYERELELFRRAVEQAGHGVVITDRNGTIQYANPAYERDTGFSREEVRGLNPRIIKSGKHDDTFYEEMWRTILAGDVWEANIVNRRKNGELYHVDQTIAPITDDGDITHFVGIETDVTERRLREQRLDVLNRILRHNLRNAMNVIVGNADLLRSELDGDLETAAEDIWNRAAELVETSEKASTAQKLFDDSYAATDRCDVSALLSKLREEFEQEYPDADVTVTVDGSLVVRGDYRLAIAIREAVDNAVVHTDQSVPSVRVDAEEVDGDGTHRWIDVEVADSGPGIPLSERSVIEQERETPLHHGSGLGLWIVHWIVSLFGGEVMIDNGSQGSVVTLRLPAAPSAGD